MPELDWCGQPIKPGQGYGGREENISETWSQNPTTSRATEKQHKHFEVITERDVCEVFGGGADKLTRAEAAKLLEELTGAHRTNCYRALRLNGRFARHLHTDGATLRWR